MTFPIVLAHGIAPSDRLRRDTLRDGDARADAPHDVRRIRGRLIRQVSVDVATDLAQRSPTA